MNKKDFSVWIVSWPDDSQVNIIVYDTKLAAIEAAKKIKIRATNLFNLNSENWTENDYLPFRYQFLNEWFYINIDWQNVKRS